MNFNAIDTNGDLKIDLKEALDNLGMDQNLETPPTWFSDMDANKDGFLSYSEFVAGRRRAFAETGKNSEF